MTPLMTTVVVVAALVMAGWSLVLTALDKRVGKITIGGLAVAEAAVLVMVVLAAVLLAQGHRPTEFWTFVGYLAASLVVLPIGTVWALSERSRWATVVLAVACLVVPVLVLRLNQIWSAGG